MDSENNRTPVYPNIVSWVTKKDGIHKLNIFTWVRFWRDDREYEMPIKLDVELGKIGDTNDQMVTQFTKQYEETFHERCLQTIRYGKSYGDFAEPITFNSNHVVRYGTEEEVSEGNEPVDDVQGMETGDSTE